MTDTAALLERYLAATTPRERATIALALWQACPNKSAQVGEGGRATYVLSLLPEQDTPQMRYLMAGWLVLAGAGAAADPLWDRLDGNMAFGTATRLLREARANRFQDETLAVSLARALARYDALPDQRADGAKVVKKTRAGESPKAPAAPPKAGHGEGSFWASVRGLIDTFLDERLAGLSDAVLLAEKQRTLTELRCLLDAASERISELRRTGTASLSATVSRQVIRQACGVLRLDAPKAIDEKFIKTARSRFKQLAREYHPDHSGGATREQYDAVIQAWKTLQAVAPP